MAKHNELGSRGEEQAQKYLISRGYTIRATNWKFQHLELDIIAQKNDWLVVVEVKTRSANFLVRPEQAVTLRKIKNIVAATNEYILRHQWEGNVRFDIVAIVPKREGVEVHHFEDAFVAPLG